MSSLLRRIAEEGDGDNGKLDLTKKPGPPPPLPTSPAPPGVPTSESSVVSSTVTQSPRLGSTGALASRLGTGRLANRVSGGADGGDPAHKAAPAGASGASVRGSGTVQLSPEDEFIVQVHEDVISRLQPKTSGPDPDEVKKLLPDVVDRMAQKNGRTFTRAERERMIDRAYAEILGLGPIEPLIRDDSISEVMVNGPKMIYIERKGKIELSDINFRDDSHIMRIIDRILSPIGRRCDESQPYVDARLLDGSRVNIVIPPIALNGPTITIRKFRRTPLTVDDLIQFGSFTREIGSFFEVAIKGRMNIIVSGGTGTGKTTVLNVLSSFIPVDERIVTIEDAAELQLKQEHVVRLETRPANVEGKGKVTIRDLVANSLRMRPDRIVVGECRGGEALDMLQAMNTGHDGSMTTLHANTPRDALRRMETLCLFAGTDLPLRAIRETIASAIHVIIQLERLRDGSRRVTYVSEVQGMEGDVIVMQDVFSFRQEGTDSEGRIVGSLKPTGNRPKFMERLASEGIYISPEIFGVSNNFRRI